MTRKSPVAAALWLVNTMFCLAALYVMLDAQFIGAIQVLVYAGAIMVVFLFVIMLLNLGHPTEIADARGMWPKLAAGSSGSRCSPRSSAAREGLPGGADARRRLRATEAASTGAVAPIAGRCSTSTCWPSS